MVKWSQGSLLWAVLLWVIDWPCLKGKLELQLGNLFCRSVGVALQVRCLCSLSLTASRVGVDLTPAFTCTFCGFLLYQNDSSPLRSISWIVDNLSMFSLGTYISSDHRTRKKKSCLSNGRATIHFSDQSGPCIWQTSVFEPWPCHLKVLYSYFSKPLFSHL